MTEPEKAFNVRGKGRHYEHPDGRHVPSVTNIISVIDRPAIPRWAAKMVAEQAWKLRHSLDSLGEAEAIDVLKGSPWRGSKRAADRGTSIHEWLDSQLNGTEPFEDLSEEARTYLPAAQAFLDNWKPEAVLTECTVFGDGYAGTFDFLAHLDGRLVIGDFKTNAKGQVYPEVALQLAALRYADQMVDPDGSYKPLPDVDGCVAVAIGPEGYSVVDVAADEDTHRAFLACRDLWMWQKHGAAIGGKLQPGQKGDAA